MDYIQCCYKEEEKPQLTIRSTGCTFLELSQTLIVVGIGHSFAPEECHFSLTIQDIYQ